jgi:hypothetical protein
MSLLQFYFAFLNLERVSEELEFYFYDLNDGGRTITSVFYYNFVELQ